MKKITAGIIFGTAAGIADVIPMIIQGLTWDANLSAFTLWIVSGVLIGTTAMKLSPVLKGIIITLLVLLPNSFIIGWHNPAALIPVIIITILLGALLGFAVDKYSK